MRVEQDHSVGRLQSRLGEVWSAAARVRSDRRVFGLPLKQGAEFAAAGVAEQHDMVVVTSQMLDRRVDVEHTVLQHQGAVIADIASTHADRRDTGLGERIEQVVPKEIRRGVIGQHCSTAALARGAYFAGPIRPESLATPEYTSTSPLVAIGMPSNRSLSKLSMTPSMVSFGCRWCVEMNDTCATSGDS